VAARRDNEWGSATISDATVSQGKQEANGSGRWRPHIKMQQRTNRTSCRGRATRGIATIAGMLRGGCVSRGWVAKAAQRKEMLQPARANKRQMGGGRWRWHVESQGHAKRMSSGGNAATSRTRGMGGRRTMRGNSAVRGRDAGRSEAAA
jgi:hypothetical protein